MNLPKGWKLVLNATKQKVEEYWNKLKNFDTLFNDSVQNDEENWFRKMYGELVILENNGGIVVFNNFVCDTTAEVHMSFWDKQLPPKRIKELKDILIWFFVTWNFNRIETVVPEYARGVQRFLEQKMNFTFEGRLRKRFLYKGQLTDHKIYSILRQEVL